MTVNNIFIPSFKCQKNQYHILPDNNKLINDIFIQKDGDEVVISKIYESLELSCNYDKDIHLSPTIYVDDDDKVIDTDFVLSNVI